MSYFALGGNSGTTPAAVAALAATGVSTTMANAIWFVAGFVIVGGALVTFAKLGPRVALESIKMPGTGTRRPWLTVNGRPVGRRFRR